MQTARTRAGGLTAAVGALIVVVVVAALLLLGGSDYSINARFADAGQLIKGADVQVAGRKVGSISAITLAADGQANVRLHITDDSLVPLRLGTRATIRAVGQAGVASRFVDLSPGPVKARALHDGAILSSNWTTGIVDLDELLDSLDAPARADIQQLIEHSSEVFAGSGSRYFNQMLGRLEPAMAAASGVTQDLAHDDRALATLVHSGAVAATALAGKRSALESATVHSAQAFNAIAAERASVSDILRRAPASLRRAKTTLRDASDTVTAVRPMLRTIPPAAGPLRDVLTQMPPSLGKAKPVVDDLRGQLPALRASLRGFVPLAKPAVNGLTSLAGALTASAPLVRGLRVYGADFVLGVTNGLAGIITSNYNATGHYGRLNFVENPQTLFAGIPASILSQQAFIPGLLSTRTGITAMCPGGNEPPAPDGSNPWIPDPSLCDPSGDIPASVNGP